MAISFSVLAGVVVLFISNRFPVEIVAVAATLTLYGTGVLDLDQALSGFGDPTVIFIATLFVVSEGLDSSGVTAWAGKQLIARVGSSRTRLVVLTMLLVAALTAVISVNGAVAALLPMVVVLAVRLDMAPSQLLMPLAFAAHAGSMLALTGTPVNVIASEASVEAGGDAFGYFEYSLVGVPLLAGTIAVVVLLGDRLLPTYRPRSIPADLSKHARTLLQHYEVSESVARLRVRATSPLLGERPETIEVGGQAQPLLLERPDTGSRASGGTIEEGDIIVARGSADSINALADEHDLALCGTTEHELARSLLTGELGVAEVVIPPRSSAIGTRAFPGMVTSSGDLVVLGIRRRGEDLGPGGAELDEGDALLLQGTWEALEQRIDDDPSVLVVDEPSLVRRQVTPPGREARRALMVLGGMVVLLATGATPAAVAGLLAAVAMVLLRVVTTERAYRSISWTTVVLVGAMIPVSTAMQVSGAAQEVADAIVDTVGDSSPYLLAIALFAVTASLGQLISNTATALIVIPIAVTAAFETGVSHRPLLMTVNIAAAASFLTPVATPVNMMVMGPAGYRFADYWKLGLPLMALFFGVAVFLVPVYWPY